MHKASDKALIPFGSLPARSQEKFTNLSFWPDVLHGFHGDYRPFYDEAPAKDGWQKMLDWFRDNGVDA